jgi:hypothetical protein
MVELVELSLAALFLHNLGYVFGTGGAVLVNLFNVWIDRIEQLRPFKLSIMNIPFNLVWLGLILMLVIHTGELATTFVRGGDELVHTAKFIAIYAILAGMSYIKFSLIPRVKRLAPKAGEKPSSQFLSVRRQTRVVPPILLVLWFVDFVLNTIWEPIDAFGFLTV